MRVGWVRSGSGQVDRSFPWAEAEAVVMEAVVSVRFRDVSGREAECGLERADVVSLVSGMPWRVFRSHRGQAHFSGWYFSTTMGRLVVYESRLELARLLIADFDPGVVAIAAQPFLVPARDGGRVRRHVPDFLLVDVRGAVTVVNVKPAVLLGEMRVAEALAWAGGVFTVRGWAHEVWSGQDAQFMENLRFVAGYRFASRVDPAAVEAVRACMRGGPALLGEVESLLRGRGLEVRPAVLHLVWRHELYTDLTAPLGTGSVLEPAA